MTLPDRLVVTTEALYEPQQSALGLVANLRHRAIQLRLLHTEQLSPCQQNTFQRPS